jgi:hypothetical protein
MKKISILAMSLFLNICSISAQKGWNQYYSNKGHWYGFWGYNISGYTKSDISFRGENYDFTLYNVDAADRPTPFSANEYFNPSTISIPQWNIRFGYFFSEKWSVSFGTDHMKYVMPQGQMVAIEGYINIPESVHNGVYNGQEKELTEEFLKFEHTDGLNYVSIDFEYNDNLYRLSKNHAINYYIGPGAGILIPRTNITLMNYPRYDEFHVAGFGISGKVGLEFILWKHLIFNIESKNGFIDMPDILTTGEHTNDRSKQTFWFSEFTWSVGFLIGRENPHKESK